MPLLGGGYAWEPSRLLGIGPFFTRPGASRPVEGAARGVVGGLLDRAEDRALDRPGQQQPAPRDVAVLRVPRPLVVDHAPEPVEELLSEDAGGEADRDRDRDEQDRGHAPRYTRAGAAHAPRCAGVSRPG